MTGDCIAMHGVLRLSCPDRMGIVAGVAAFLLEHSCNIVESAQFGDPNSQRFFMRVSFSSAGADLPAMRRGFAEVAQRFAMQWEIDDMAVKRRALIMVSRFGHCLNDLLYRWRSGALPIEIAAIVSNHRDWYRLAAAHDIPYHHLPVTAADKPRRERQLLDIFAEERCDLLILARYMQVLSPELCGQLEGRAINIHHSFLPSFQGARPYQQAHDRGVKLMGATAHYVTSDLDEGPIIEQDVIRVSHMDSIDELTRKGFDVEKITLARAIRRHLERKTLVFQNRVIVFN